MCPPHALQALLPGCSSTVPDKSTASQQAAAQRRSRACLCVSPAGRALLVSVAGTTSAGRLRYSRRYSMPLSVRNLNNSRNPDAAQTARQIREHHPCVQPADDVCCYSGYATRRAASRCRATQLLLLSQHGGWPSTLPMPGCCPCCAAAGWRSSTPCCTAADAARLLPLQ